MTLVQGLGEAEPEWAAHVEGATRILEEAAGFRAEAEAVAWARVRAPVVLVRTPGGYATAGERPPDERPDLPVWEAP